MFERHEFQVRTERNGVLNITEKVVEKINDSEIKNGFCLVFSRHTTAGIIVNENEKGLVEDMESFLEKLAPEDKKYMHNRGPDKNGHAHLRNILTGSGQTLPVEKGSLVSGTWQNIFLVEGDSPRTRNIDVYLIGEK